MKQFRAVLYLLLVIGGGAMAAYGLVFNISRTPLVEIAPAGIGLLVLASGISLLGMINDRKRVKLVVSVVGLSGLGMIIADGILQLDGLAYVGIATMIAAGILLFVTRPSSTRIRGGDVS